MADGTGVQRTHAPNSICFGCGPANAVGLRIDSYTIENGLRTEFDPREEHQAFPGMLNGGIIGTLLDCHGNWTAAMAIMAERGEDEPPCTVTASYSIKLRRPTPIDTTLVVTSGLDRVEGNRAYVKMELHADDILCAQGEGLFVAVEQGHPAYHRWH